MPVIALIVITVLNDGTIVSMNTKHEADPEVNYLQVSIAYDRVTPPKTPQSWVMLRLWGMAFTLGIVACSSSILLLYLALDSHS